jgi:carbamoyltransferase
VNILGVWDGHDAGAALLADGQLVAAVNEERLTRRKLDIVFPQRSIQACLDLAGLDRSAIDIVASSTSDVAKAVGRILPSTKQTYYDVRRRKAAPGRMASYTRRSKYLITEWPPNALSRSLSRWALGRMVSEAGLASAALEVYDHHACHAAGAAYASGFRSCLTVTIDGLGDGRSATVSLFRDGVFELLASTPARHSPGVFFEHVTQLLNMRELEDEGKVMALADYAAPLPDDRNPMLTLLTANGLCFSTAVPGSRLHAPLKKILWSYPNEQFAFMAQRTLERACEAVVSNAVRQTGERRIALAGGVASNIKVNRRLRRLDGVDDVFVFPHMGDGGLALGAALLAQAKTGIEPVLCLDDLGLGPEYPVPAIEAALRERGLSFQACGDLPRNVAGRLAEEQVGLWFQGRMEYGPRSLGHRCVLARPDRPRLRDRLNRLLKRRVWYQPFCPSILERDAPSLLADFTGRPNRHMTMAYQVADAHYDSLSGVMNVDGSCRPQFVPDDAPGPFAALLREMRTLIGVGVVLNTSFNLHGSPLVCTPGDAIEVFVESGADFMAIGPFLAVPPAGQ